MDNQEKKAFMLLKSVILHYHGLDEDEERMLNESADKLEAHVELQWANNFIAQDLESAFDRSRNFLNEVIGRLEKNQRLSYLNSVWQDNNRKGYITEMEATAMLNLAKDWKVHEELMELVKE